MLQNYLKIAWRNLFRNPMSSFINIGGLAVGMTVVILIGLWIYDELSFNAYHKNYEHIGRVMQQQTANNIVETDEAVPFPLEAALQTDYGTNFKFLVSASYSSSHILTHGAKNISRTGCYMSSDAPSMLTLEMLRGTRNGLADPHSVLLSASTATAIFGDVDPVNQAMRIDSKIEVKVTGVYKDLPFNTTFRDLGFIAPWELYITSESWIQRAKTQQLWDNNSFRLFAQITENTDFETINNKIVNIKQDRVDEQTKRYQSKIILQPMRDWHLRSHWNDDGKQTGGLIEYVWLFSITGIFVLLLASINFMNLSTARAEKRAKEVGVRKAIGSLRRQLIAQFYNESALVVVFAFVAAITFTVLLLPWFNDLASKKMYLPLTSSYFWLSAIAFTVITGFLAGSYPALYLSSFQSVQVLKGTFKAGRFTARPRQALVVLQFTISLALIIGTLIVYSQIQYSKNRPIGYNRNGLLMVDMMSPDFYGKFDLLRNELKQTGAIEEMAESSSPVTAVWATNDGFSWPGKDPNINADFASVWVTHDFGKTIGWQFKEGRDFSRHFTTDSSAILVNEAAIRYMGIKKPIGTTVQWHGRNYTIIGVINDMLMSSPYEPVKHTIYFLDYDNVNWMILKLNPSRSARESIVKVEAAFKRYIPSAPFDYKFADSEFAAKFATEERVGKLAAFFAGLAIFISSLGLFGLTAFVAEQRRKEIGVRKVLGATVFNLWKLLSAEFVWLVVISLFIAVPLAYYVMSKWLLNYAYRTEVSWWVFVAAGAGGLIITLITVSFQSIKAAIANPVDSLRSE